MKHLMRAVIAGAASIAAVAATIVPAQAYYKERVDPAGDIVFNDCTGVAPRALDLRKVGVATYLDGSRWKMDLTFTVARFRKPPRGGDTGFGTGINVNGRVVLSIGVNWGWVDGEPKRSSYIGDSWDPDAPYTTKRAHVTARGNAVRVVGIPLRAGYNYLAWKPHTYSALGRTCRAYDAVRSIGSMQSTS